MFLSIVNDDCNSALQNVGRESVDLIVTSPPYCMKKAYESPEDDINTFKQCHEKIFDKVYKILKPGASICWQIGYHISDACVIPLDFIV